MSISTIRSKKRVFKKEKHLGRLWKEASLRELFLICMMGSMIHGSHHRQAWWRVLADCTVFCIAPCVTCYLCCFSSVKVDTVHDMSVLKRNRVGDYDYNSVNIKFNQIYS